MKGKEINKILRREGNKLPLEMYVAYPKELRHLTEEEMGEKIEDIKVWMNVPTEYPVNHGRRLWRTFLRQGLQGVEEYLNKRGFTLKYK